MKEEEGEKAFEVMGKKQARLSFSKSLWRGPNLHVCARAHATFHEKPLNVSCDSHWNILISNEYYWLQICVLRKKDIKFVFRETIYRNVPSTNYMSLDESIGILVRV